MGTIDDYLSELEEDDAAVIGRVYEAAAAAVPGTEQGTGYGMPALIYRGKPLLAVKRFAKHVGVYPFSPEAIDAVRDRLAGLDGVGTDKGTIRFQAVAPLPDDVVQALAIARKEQIDR